MEDAFSLKYGVAGICVMLTVMVLIKVGEFIWSVQKKNETATSLEINRLTQAVKENTESIRHLELSLSEIQKLKVDVRRYYSAIKTLAGERWPEIRDEILAEDEVHP